MAFARFLAFFILFGILSSPEAKSQIYKISGRIVDSETLEPLPYAHVFIDQTTIGAVSDFNGEFVIDNVANGEYKLVYSFVGYELFYKLVTINNRDARASARLIPQKGELQNVEVKGTRDKEWEGRLRQFNKIFFGDNEFASFCKILNPWVLEFDYDSKEKKLKATASAPLEIENRALGYAIVCNLLGFTSDKQSYKIKGLYKFDELNTLDSKEAARWTRNRRQAYQNSLRFLIKSIVENHASENGFEIYLDNRPLIYASNTGLFSHEEEKGNVQLFRIADRLRPEGKPGFYKISLNKRIEIHHTTQFARNKTYRDVPYSVSWIEVEKGSLIVSENGYILNNDEVVTSGELNRNRVSTMLPLDYSPGSVVVINYLTKRNIAKRLQERVYVQTDKTVYHKGELLWFKAHMNYANQSVKDSLSRVLYVELVDHSSVVESKILNIDSLGARGSFLISEKLVKGEYFLRAYTNWMKNYGAGLIQYVPILISDNDTKVVWNNFFSNSGDFISENRFYRTDSSSLLLALDSAVIQSVANCAISITPAESAISDPELIKNNLLFEDDLPDGTLPDFIYPVEFGFGIRGRIIHSRKKNIQGQITAIRGKMDSLYSFKTDSRGNFAINDLIFWDTTLFSFQVKNKKGKILARTELLQRETPSLKNGEFVFKPNLDTIQLSVPVQFAEPKTTRVNLPQQNQEKEPNSIVFADYVLTQSDLEKMPSNQSIISALHGRVPGLRYDFLTKSISFKGNRIGSEENVEPLLIVDGLPIFSGQPAKQYVREGEKGSQNQQAQAREGSQSTQENQSQIQNQLLTNAKMQPEQTQENNATSDLISHLTVSSVSRVEITTRMDPRYGSLGANGVIAIYTKKVQGRGDVKPFDVFQVEGFAKPLPFSQAVNYAGNPPTEYTPTWYWNPDVQISSTQFTQIKFPTLPKGVVFRVSINGVTKAGTPVSGSFLLNGGNTKPVSASLDQRQK